MTEARKKLIEALRSGEYQKADGALRDGCGFCVLGVACDLFDPKAWIENEHGEYLFNGLHDAEPPTYVMEALGLRPDLVPDIIELNDTYGLSFQQLADRFETENFAPPPDEEDEGEFEEDYYD